MTRTHYLIFAAFALGAMLTGCSTTQQDAAGKAVIAVGQKIALDSFNHWLEQQ